MLHTLRLIHKNNILHTLINAQNINTLNAWKPHFTYFKVNAQIQYYEIFWGKSKCLCISQPLWFIAVGLLKCSGPFQSVTANPSDKAGFIALEFKVCCSNEMPLLAVSSCTWSSECWSDALANDVVSNLLSVLPEDVQLM